MEEDGKNGECCDFDGGRGTVDDLVNWATRSEILSIYDWVSSCKRLGMFLE